MIVITSLGQLARIFGFVLLAGIIAAAIVIARANNSQGVLLRTKPSPAAACAGPKGHNSYVASQRSRRYR